MPSATRKFHDYSVTMPKINAYLYHIYLYHNNDDVTV